MADDGHQIGSKHASARDHAPEFHAQTMPAGTAPTSKMHHPNPDLNNQGMYTSASNTMHGATSADMHQGMGHPGQGMSSNEMRHDGMHGNKKQGMGTIGLTRVGQGEEHMGRDPDFSGQRALNKDVETGMRGNRGGDYAEDRMPEDMGMPMGRK